MQAKVLHNKFEHIDNHRHIKSLQGQTLHQCTPAISSGTF